MLLRTPRILHGDVHYEVDGWVEDIQHVTRFYNWTDAPMLDIVYYSLDHTARSCFENNGAILASSTLFYGDPEEHLPETVAGKELKNVGDQQSGEQLYLRPSSAASTRQSERGGRAQDPRPHMGG